MKCGTTNAKLIGIIVLILIIVVIVKSVKVSENFYKFTDDAVVEEQINKYNLFQKQNRINQHKILLEKDKQKQIENNANIINKLVEKVMLIKSIVLN